MALTEEVGNDYKASLVDLNFNSKPLINMLTMFAEDQEPNAPHIVKIIEDHINKVDEKTRVSMFNVRQTWTSILPNQKLYMLDKRINSLLDPAWPITAKAPGTQSVRVDPRCLAKTASDGERSSPEVQDEAEPDQEEEEEPEDLLSIMMQELIAKQQELLKLKQESLELEQAEAQIKIKKTKNKRAADTPVHNFGLGGDATESKKKKTKKKKNKDHDGVENGQSVKNKEAADTPVHNFGLGGDATESKKKKTKKKKNKDHDGVENGQSVKNKEEEEGCQEALLNGKTGMVLSNCVKIIDDVIEAIDDSDVIEAGEKPEQMDTGYFDDVDPRYFNAYIDALKDGKEKTNTIRVNVVGNACVGKSTLTKNLLGMIPDRNIDRTDGIEVHCYKCNGSSDWSSKDVTSDEKTAHRIAMSSSALQSKEQPIEVFDINTSPIVQQPNQTKIETPSQPSDDESVQAVGQTSLSESLPTNDERGPLLTEVLKINETEKERINRFSSKLKEGDLTDVTCIQIWDFGGQFDYYATHQLFHSQRAVYLLVLDASVDFNDITETCELTNASGDKDVQYFCKFWMQSIHSFVGNDKNEPPVILVATKTDEKPGWNEEKQKEFFESVRQLFDGSPVGYHIQSKCFAINNFSEDAADFKNLRQYIEEVAKTQDSWNSTVPARWIPLEDSLSRRTSEKHLTLQQIRTIGSELNVPINDELQIKAFLMYQHALGNLVYFDDDDLSESVVIDPQWIIDAFKTLITAKAKQYCLEKGPLRDKWVQLTKEAILSKELIKAIWNNVNENDFSSNEDILLKYLIKLGIISEVTELDLENHIVDHKDYFFVPSLLKAKSSQLCLKQLMEGRTVTQTALVFAFDDKNVPLLLHHRLTAAALGKWNVLVFRDQRLLAENIGVYELDEVHAGLIEVCDTSIEIRVVNLCGKYINPTQTNKLRRFVRFKIDAEFQRFSKTSPYTLRIRCNFNNNKGKQTIELSKLENSEYDSLPCPDKDHGHDIKTADIRNQWSYPGVNISRDKNDKELLKSLRDDTRRDLTLSVTEREFYKVANALGFNWELLGIDLGISNASIQQIKIDNPGACKTQIFQMLKTWAEKEGEKASMEKLLAAIAGLVDTTVDWDKIRNILDE